MDVFQMAAEGGSTNSEPRPIGDVLTVVMSRYGIATQVSPVTRNEKQVPGFRMDNNPPWKSLPLNSLSMRPRRQLPAAG